MLTEQEIRPQDLMAEQARLFAADIAKLMRHRDAFVEVTCPACASSSYRFLFEKSGMPFVCCNGCETWYANPRPRPEHLEEYYQQSQNYQYWSQHIFPASEANRREKIFKPRVDWLLERCTRFNVPTDTLIEVGAGFGLFCEELTHRQQFETIWALEPTPYLAEDCRKRGLQVLEKTIEQAQLKDFPLSQRGFDALVSFEVIEHVFSPREFLLQCARLLRAGGLLMLSCPNSKGFDIAMLGEKSSAVDVEHLNLFHPKALKHLLKQCGFEILDMQTPGHLDAELVRKSMLAGDLEAQAHPFLKQILLDDWEAQGGAFQDYLIANGLSSHMVITAQKQQELTA